MASKTGLTAGSPAPGQPNVYARHIGRIGALAVALGVGAAVATSQGIGVARADDTTTNTTKSPADSSPSAPSPDAEDDTSSDTATEPLDDVDTDLPQADDEPGSALPEVDVEPAEELDDPADVPSDPAPVPEPASDDTAPPIDRPDRGKSAVSARNFTDTPAPALTTTPAEPEQPVLLRTSDADDAPAPSATTTFATSTTESFATLTAAALPTLGAPAAEPLHSVSALVAAFAPFLSTGGPAAPAQPSPLLWGLAGWVRRELQYTFTNKTPNARDQAVSLTAGQTSTTIDLAASDPDGSPLTISVPARGEPCGPTHGTVSVDQANGTVTYTPDAGYTGTDTFTYTVSDQAASGLHFHGLFGFLRPGRGHADTATVTVTTTATPATPTPTIGLAHDSGIPGDKITNNPTLAGAGPAGGTIVVRDGVNTIGTVTTDAAGAWTFTPTGTAAIDGPHSYTAQVRDAAGNLGPATPPLTVTVDTVAPPESTTIRPRIDTGVVGDNVTSDATLSGTISSGAEGRLVTVLDGTAIIGTATTGPGGTWTFTPTGADGIRTYSAAVTDVAGNRGAVATTTVTVDRQAPNTPSITTLLDDAGSTTGPVAPGGSTDDAQPAITGTADAGATVTVYNGETSLGTTQANAAGNWILTPATSLADGTYTLTAIATDTAGNQSQRSIPRGVTVATPDTTAPDTTAPDAPVITGVFDDLGEVGESTNDMTLTMSGTAEAGASITVRDATGTVVGAVLADQTGAWNTELVGLTEGPVSLTVVATDASGNTSTPTTLPTITIDVTAPDAPDVTSPTDTDNPTPTLTGTAEAGTTITLSDDTTVLGTAVAGTDGTWTITPNTPLAEGTNTLTIRATDAAGNLSYTRTVEITVTTVDTTAPDAPDITGVFDDFGTGVMSGDTTDDTTPTIIGTAEAGATVSIYDGSTRLGTAEANELGTWRFTPDAALAEGTHTFTASATDAAGNESALSAGYEVSIATADTTAPDAPVVTGVFDDRGAVENGRPTNDTTLTMTGTAEAGTTVTVRDDTGTVVGVALADADTGAWSTELIGLREGPTSLTAVAADAVGNVSPPSSSLFTIDITAPDAPEFTSPPTTNSPTPTLSGTAEEGADVVISDGAGTVLAVVAASVTGTWTYTSAPLPDGTYEFSAQARDKAGNLSAPSDTYAVTIDTVPSTPAITGPGAANDATPTLSGTAAAGTTITVTEGAAVLGTAVADSDGKWTIVSAALSEGSHSLIAYSTDLTGNVSAPSDTYTITIDTTAPSPPAITGPAATNDATPTLSGTAEAGATITISEGDTLLGTTTADAEGTWSLTLDTPLAPGDHIVNAQATDAVGNVSAPATQTVTIDITAPPAPTIGAIDDIGSLQGQLTSGAATDDVLPTIAGTAAADSEVTIYDGDTVIGTATADPTGTWSLTPAALSEGVHTLTATATDAAGNISMTSIAFTVTIDTAAPAAPTITGPANTNIVTPTLSGNGEAGATITVFDGAAPLGTTTVGANGAWSLKPTAALTPGTHAFTARATDAAGNTGPSSASVVVAIDVVAPLAPSITGPAGGITSDNRPTVSGTAEAGTKVSISRGTTLLGTATADASGKWAFTPSALADGVYTLSARATDKAGNISVPSTTLTLTVDTTAPAEPTVAGVFDDAGSTPVRIAGGGTTTDTTLTVTGTAEPGAKVLIYDGGVLLDSLRANTTGDWTWTSPTLAEGTVTLSAAAEDAAGNVGSRSPDYEVTVIGTIAPPAPTIDGVVDQVGGIQGPVNDGAITDDTSPTIYGTADAGTAVSISANDVVLGSTEADDNGHWSFTPANSLPQGTVSLHATATNSVGQTSAGSTPYTVRVDTTVPLPPTITHLYDNVGPTPSVIAQSGITDDARPEIFGTAEPGASVSIYVGGLPLGSAGLLGTTQADAAGDWRFTPSAPLKTILLSPTIQLNAIATDAAGNTSGSSVPFVFGLVVLPLGL